MKKNLYFLTVCISFAVLTSCIELFDAATTEFEDVIVIEALLTNEFKNHTVKLTRTYKFEENTPTVENGASVKIITNKNIIYDFSETNFGSYSSNIPFKAESDTNYKLRITLKNGKVYESEETQLTKISKIDSVYALKTRDKDGFEGIGLYVDSFDASNSSKRYGYQFDETYKIIAPFWFPEDIIITPAGGLAFAPRSQNERICYNTVISKGRLLTSTNLLDEDRVDKLLLKFIPNDDIRLITRYSILVKQYIQSSASYNYYRVLGEFSESQSLLSQVQPGFLPSNIFNINDNNEKVLGFFEVSSVAKKRFYFNREEFFENDFPLFCQVTEPTVAELKRRLRSNRVKLIGVLDPDSPKPFQVVPRICGDCTAAGSSIKPIFWED